MSSSLICILFAFINIFQSSRHFWCTLPISFSGLSFGARYLETHGGLALRIPSAGGSQDGSRWGHLWYYLHLAPASPTFSRFVTVAGEKIYWYCPIRERLGCFLQLHIDQSIWTVEIIRSTGTQGSLMLLPSILWPFNWFNMIRRCHPNEYQLSFAGAPSNLNPITWLVEIMPFKLSMKLDWHL